MFPPPLMVIYFIAWLCVVIFLLVLAYRFVKAHERMADSIDRMARAPSREMRDPRA